MESDGVPRISVRGAPDRGCRHRRVARLRGVPHLYLGYWIAHHPKMGYKARFDNLQVLGPDGWAPIARPSRIKP